MMQFSEQKEDYLKIMSTYDETSEEEYREAMSACHQRGAERCVKVANLHRGLYVKAAQFIASIRGGTGDRGVPSQYTEALSVFTDQAPSKPVAEIAIVLKEFLCLGDWPAGEFSEDSAFSCFEEKPLASASLAQVHRATLRDGAAVAVKLQYPELQTEMASDFYVCKSMGEQIRQASKGYDVMWVVEDFEKYISRELDFELEATNCELTASLLAHWSPRVFVPRVYREYSSKRVLTMEFCEGLLKADDPQALRAAGLDPLECAVLLCETFSEMIFVHGRVHADPHAGNIYFRAMTEGGVVRPQLVVLDHGLYHDLNENSVRLRLCRYWIACCAKDSNTMRELGQQMAGALYRFLPLILSPWFVFGSPDVRLSEIVAAARGQLPDSVGLTDIADFIVATRAGGANLVGLLHSLGYTRGLLNALGLPERQRLRAMLSFALRGNSEEPSLVPVALTLSQRSSVNWRVGILGASIHVMAPFAPLLLRFRNESRAPPLWLVASVPVFCFAAIVGGSMAWARHSPWFHSVSLQ